MMHSEHHDAEKTIIGRIKDMTLSYRFNRKMNKYYGYGRIKN